VGFGERRGRRGSGQKRREVESGWRGGMERRGFCAEKGRTLGGRRPWKALELPYKCWNALERRALQYLGREARGDEAGLVKACVAVRLGPVRGRCLSGKLQQFLDLD
jgi:hypothetical protein